MGRLYQLFACCLLVALSAPLPALPYRKLDWLTNRCLDAKPWVKGTLCNDNEAHIACLKKAQTIPNLSDMDRLQIISYLNGFLAEKASEERCPSLKARQTCLHDALMGCVNQTHDCDTYGSIVGCLVELNVTCGGDEPSVLGHLDKFKEEVNICNSGVYECHDEIRGCIQEWKRLHTKGQIQEACKEMTEAEQCLDELNCTYRYQYKFNVRWEMKSHERECKNGNE